MDADANCFYHPLPAVQQKLGRICAYPLTLALAPAGFGKTAALRACVRESGCASLWLTVNGPSEPAFWSDFAALFAARSAACAKELARLGPPKNALAERMALAAIAALAFCPDTLLVLDDYHKLQSADVARFLEALVREALPGLHLVVLSRAPLGERTAELVARGLGQRIEAADFVFGAADALAYCRAAGVGAAQARVLQRKSRGWISALRLYLQQWRQSGSLACPPALRALLEAYFLAHSPPLCRFLLHSSVFETFTLPQAAFFCPRPLRPALRGWLEDDGFFCRDENGCYRAHPLLRGYLREAFARRPWRERRAVYRRAGKWRERQRAYAAAMEFYARAEDFDRLLLCLEADRERMRFDFARLRRYFAACSAEVRRRHPLAWLRYAARLFLATGDGEAFARELASLGQALDALPDSLARRQLCGERKVVESLAACGDLAALKTRWQAAGRLLQQPPRIFGDALYWGFGSPSILLLYHRESGALEREIAAMTAVMPQYCRLQRQRGCGAETVMAAEAAWLRGEFQRAEIGAYHCVALAAEHRQFGIAVCAGRLLLGLALLRGEFAEARRVVAGLRRRASVEDSFHTPSVDMLEARLRLACGEAEAVPDWIAAGEFARLSLPLPGRLYPQILHAEYLLATGRENALLARFHAFQRLNNTFASALGQVCLELCAAAAHERRQARPAARACLRAAIARAWPDRILLPFLQNHALVGTLLEDAGSPLHADFLAALRVCAAAVPQWNRLECLTARERQIALLAAKGLRNRRIAALVGSAESTVKKTLQSVYAKLSIGNRTMLSRIVAQEELKKR